MIPLPPHLSHFSYLEAKPFNVNANETDGDKLSPENELAEYFIQYRADDLLGVIDSLEFNIDVDENDIIKQVLYKSMETFRNVLRDAVTTGVIMVNFDRDDVVNINTNNKRLRNNIKINFNVPTNVDMADLTASDYEGEIVVFEAQVAYWSKKTSVTIKGEYKCPECDFKVTRPFRGKLVKDKCTEDNAFCEFYKPSMSEDFRRVTLREVTKNFTKNNLPSTITADIYGKTVKEVALSDKVIVTGIFRSIPLKFKDGKISQEFIPTIQVISIQNTTEKTEFPSMELMAKFRALEEEGKLVDEIIKGYSYNIYKKTMEKKALICSIIGSQWIGDIGNGNAPMIHVLFAGDPDTYKSTLMKNVTKVFDNCILADATTVSNAGIKAIAVKTDDGRMSITAGLLPTHNEGVVYLDEFGDLSPTIYADLKAPMIDGNVTKNVAGENFNGTAETAIWGSMNPVDGVWNTNKTILENLVKLGKALITRFDIMFLFDLEFVNVNEAQIEELMDRCDEHGKPDDVLTDHEIKLFLNYVKTIKVTISPDALRRKNEFFSDIKKKSKDKKSVEQRTKNSIIKFAVALAKWHMSTVVSAQHVNEAIELYKASLATFGMQFENGEFINESSLKKTEDGRRTAIHKAYDELKNEEGYVFQDELIDKALEYKCFASRGQAEALINVFRMESIVSDKNKMIRISW
jgi:DNA replicative helicase MCM subunit Mcm2 (Cdc46/Mcm family)